MILESSSGRLPASIIFLKNSEYFGQISIDSKRAFSDIFLVYYLDGFTFRFNRRTSASRGKLFYRLVQQTVMLVPAPIISLKGAALPFLEGTANLNLDPIDNDLQDNI